MNNQKIKVSQIVLDIAHVHESELNSFFDAIKNLNDNKEFKTELLFMGIGLNDSDITEQYKNAGDMLDTININDLK